MEKKKKIFEVRLAGELELVFELVPYTPRKNDFERGLRYRLLVNDIDTGYKFSTITEARLWLSYGKNYLMYL